LPCQEPEDVVVSLEEPEGGNRTNGINERIHSDVHYEEVEDRTVLFLNLVDLDAVHVVQTANQVLGQLTTFVVVAVHSAGEGPSRLVVNEGEGVFVGRGKVASCCHSRWDREALIRAEDLYLVFDFIQAFPHIDWEVRRVGLLQLIKQVHHILETLPHLHSNPILVLREPLPIITKCHILVLDDLMHLEPKVLR